MLSISEMLASFEMPLGEAALVSLLGILIVFAVLAVLVGILTLFKLVFNIKLTKNKTATEQQSVKTDEEDPDEIVAVITAVLACMNEEEVKAPFRVKSITKLK